MKVIVKESDKLVSKLHKGKTISECLIYITTDDDKEISCDMVYGESLEKVIQKYIHPTQPTKIIKHQEFLA